MPHAKLTVQGMHCSSCKMLVEEALQDIGATNILISVDEKKQVGTVSFSHDNISKVKDAIRKEGYRVS